ncbi:19569_t:CDS:2, partial [Cetraspora pellucida]
QTLIKNINNLLTNYIEALENIKLRAGLEIAMEISRQGNGYLQESKLDNTFLRMRFGRWSLDKFDLSPFRPGYQIGKAEYLFKRIDEKMTEEFSKKFAGESRDDKKNNKKASKTANNVIATVVLKAD